MVEKNNQSSEQEYQKLQQIISNGKVPNQPEEETSTWKEIGKIVLIVLGIIIAVPFLLFISCLTIVIAVSGH